jgi:hypothetical protein
MVALVGSAVPGGVAAYALTRGGGEAAVQTAGASHADTTTSQQVTTSTVSPTTTVAPSTTTTPPPAVVVAPAPQSAAVATVTGVVVRTCGSSGRGDCFLSVRSGPTSSSSELRRLTEGTRLRLLCEVTGSNATSSALGWSSNIWIKAADGGYVAAVFIDAPGFDPLRFTHPC